MATVNVSHKIRNPRDLSKWLNIWTAEIDGGNDVDNYSIIPSNAWKIPVEQLSNSGDLPSSIGISVNQIRDAVDNDNNTTTHNVTTVFNSDGSNALTKFNSEGDLVVGPILNSNGNNNSILNEKGDWITITPSLIEGEIPTAKIEDSAITTVKINDSAVTTAKIDDSAITTAKVNDGAITTAKINDGAVTLNKIDQNEFKDRIKVKTFNYVLEKNTGTVSYNSSSELLTYYKDTYTLRVDQDPNPEILLSIKIVDNNNG